MSQNLNGGKNTSFKVGTPNKAEPLLTLIFWDEPLNEEFGLAGKHKNLRVIGKTARAP